MRQQKAIKMKIIFLIILSIPLLALAQTDSLMSFSDVVHIDSASKDQLFTRAQLWVNDAFKSGKDVTQLFDKEAGTIAGKANFDANVLVYNKRYPMLFTFSFKILVKDGRYKYIFDDFNDRGLDTHNGVDGYYSFGIMTSSKTTDHKETFVSKDRMNKILNSAQEEVEKEVQLLIDGLKLSMATSSFTRKNEDF
jgi:Domain of unknown function (DUF4468) with TBP-like fold